MIKTLKDLKEHLEAAVQLELSVIPPYLCALYTMHPGANEEVCQIIRSVVVEEMLHMILAANVLNAVDGRPRVADAEMAPSYPAYLPDGEKRFEVHLLPFSGVALETFLKIEEPSRPHALVFTENARKMPKPLRVAELGNYETVGDFYKEILKGLTRLVKKLGERKVFQGDPDRQITPEYYYASGGRVVVVHDLKTAREALKQIMDQGEGEVCSLFDADGDLAHFFRFMEVKYQRRYSPNQREPMQGGHFAVPEGEPFPVDYQAVYPMVADPKADDYPEGELRQASRDFDLIYSRLLRQLQSAFDGQQGELLPAVGTMFDLKYKAQELIRNPIPGQTDLHAGPAFEFVG